MIAALAASVLLAPLPAPLLATSSQTTTSVSVTVTGLRNTHGIIQACLTAAPEFFPDCDRDPGSHRLSVHAAANLQLEFDDVAPGTYAVALLHDENSNGRVDKMLMIPREGFGFSRDAPVRMGPPHFADASFALGSVPVHQAIRMRYML
ncbi:MAG: DUF2141 domain-containing protein [Alteraurantiacibacter sp.]